MLENHVTDIDDSKMLPGEVVNLDKSVGIMGSLISQGFRKILIGDGLPDATINFVVDKVNNQHQHWQKFCNATEDVGYWQNVEGQVQSFVKAEKVKADKVKADAKAKLVAAKGGK